MIKSIPIIRFPEAATTHLPVSVESSSLTKTLPPVLPYPADRRNRAPWALLIAEATARLLPESDSLRISIPFRKS